MLGSPSAQCPSALTADCGHLPSSDARPGALLFWPLGVGPSAHEPPFPGGRHSLRAAHPAKAAREKAGRYGGATQVCGLRSVRDSARYGLTWEAKTRPWEGEEEACAIHLRDGLFSEAATSAQP